MKLNNFALAILAVSVNHVTAEVADFTPEHVSYEYLTSGAASSSSSRGEPLLDALSSEGLVSISGIPDFADVKKSVMSWLHACIMDQGIDAKHVLETIEKDGTIRRTFASKTLPDDEGRKDFMLKDSADDELSPSCIKFSENLDDFRSRVGQVTKVFAERLTSEMGASYEMPIMSTEDSIESFQTIADVVASGEHLEHFHSYQKVEKPRKDQQSLRSREETIDLHTDQGFFIAFAPGLMVTHMDDKPDLNTPLYESEGFYIEKSDGSRAHVRFTSEDDLIFMIGDGANQYINPKIKNSRTLRATPHSVKLLAHSENISRSWFGRMILPPENGISNNGKSFGEIRKILSNSESPVGSIGCSNVEQRALSAGGDGSCHGAHCADVCSEDDGNLFCWFRCMDLATHNAENCSNDTPLKCINPREQISDGFKHGDYYPACSNSTAEITDYPKLDSYPQDPDVCTDDSWEGFIAKGDYSHSVDLSTDVTKAKFMWSVNTDGNVEGRIAFDGLFGWLAVGLLNLDPDAGHKGMNGASIFMSVPGGDYSAKTGFDLTVSESVGEYQINLDGSAFRHWQDPITASNSTVTSTVVDNVEGCFTSFSFVADGINSIPFNTTGSDTMLWAANTEDAFAGYHKLNRARFEVNWATGEGGFVVDPDDDDNDVDSSSVNVVVSKTIISLMAIALMLMF